MDFILRMTVKSVCEVSPEEGRLGTAGLMSGRLRQRVNDLARKRFGDGAPLLKLQSILEKCRRVAKRRNELLHGVFARELDGPELFLGDGDPDTLDQSVSTLKQDADLENLMDAAFVHWRF